MPLDKSAFAHLKFNELGLIPAIVQSQATGRVIMMAWMNHESLSQSIEIGETVFWSRSRNELWHKGETSGNTQVIASIEVDCDSDALLIKVFENGPACHTGSESCFDTQTLYLSAEAEA
jgi:phosphoribosyl-ATP pyrophosphohydrolase/phosphoribosyl-AMP cyclohydrolase